MLIDISEDIYEKILLINIIGALEALKKGKLSIYEAEKFIFSPHMVKKLKKKQCNNQIIDILERGCELEDIISLLPQSVMENIDELKEMALKEMENYQENNRRFWI